MPTLITSSRSPLAFASLLVWCGMAIAEPPPRITEGLQVLYTFQKLESGVIPDRSGVGEPLPLRIDKPQSVLFRSGRMTVHAPVAIASDGPATKIVAATKQSNAITIEAWVVPRDADQKGPARIVTLSANPSQRNFTLGQDKDRFDARLRTTSTDENGTPSTPGPEQGVSAKLTHLVFARAADGLANLYVDGTAVATRTVTGDLSNWKDAFQLAIANELSMDRPWHGEIGLVAVYSRALSADEVKQNFEAGVPASPNFEARLPPVYDGKVDFAKDIQPIFRKHCFECHSADHEDGGVNLGIRQRAFSGGHDGPIFAPGDSAHSRLIHLVAAIEKDAVMPPDSQGLNPQEVGLLRAWIDQGAAWPEGIDIADPREVKAKSHWAFKPLRQVDEPSVNDAGWARTRIDRFILARLGKESLKPRRPADARTIIRRLTMALIGLPPTPEEVDSFCAASEGDPEQAIEKLVERLLESPHYGERWGRHWLDVARYADSDGQESDRDRPTAYLFRDFVVKAFIDDMPYDQFIRWQLAGDEYEPTSPAAVAATGFIAAGPFAALPDKLMEDERLRNRYNELDDIMSTIGTGMLGLTLGCVRCHDHKYDAIPARDYYSMLSAFHGGERTEAQVDGQGEKLLVYKDIGSTPAPTWLFQRGNYYDRDQPVSLGFISILTSGKSVDDYWKAAREASPNKASSQQRRAMADWITDPEHGGGALLARVIVNRIWQHHFGQGLVRTPGDFGIRAEAPSHPELLEWLANDFVQHGWRIKRLQRQIAVSAVYHQASRGAAEDSDPDNRLLGKMPMQRLEGEVLRDAMLAVSGTLNRDLYGPAVKPPIAEEAMLARNLQDKYPDKIEDRPELRRRSLYLFHKRVVPYPLLQAFDKPDAQQSCSRRDRTTVAPQALALLNDPFVRTVSREFAKRLLAEAGPDNASRVRRAFQLAIARAPSDGELAAAEKFLDSQFSKRQAQHPTLPDEEIQLRTLADFCQVVFSLNEFLYVD